MVEKAGVPGIVCSSCKAPNEMGAIMCKKCGELLSKKGKGKRGGDAEFDATEGSFSPACVVVPIVLILIAVIFFFFAFKKSSTPCDHNREVIGRAIAKYDKAHSNEKLMSLDFEKLKQNGSNGKPYLKEVPVCPFDSGAAYEYDGNKVICSFCSKKKK
mgnify:CR=1 FL=1